MRLLTRLLRRSLILGLGVVSVWLIVFVAFDFADQRLPWLLALSGYFNSRSGHALVSVGDENARVVWISSDRDALRIYKGRMKR